MDISQEPNASVSGSARIEGVYEVYLVRLLNSIPC